MAITVTIPQVWSARITHFLDKYSAFIPNSNRQWEGDAVYGNTVKIPTIDRSTTINDYSRTADLASPEDIDATVQDLAINQEKYFSFALEDLDARQSRIDGSTLVDVKATGAGIDMSQVIDSYVCGLFNGITVGDLARNTAAADFDLDFITDVKLTCNLLNQPFGGVVVVITPEILKKMEKGIIDGDYGDVMTAANFMSGYSNDPNGDGSMMQGFACTINGVRFFVSNRDELKLTSSNGAVSGGSRGTRSIVYVYDPRDFALVVQVNKTEVYRLEKRFATGVKGLVNYGAKVLNAGRMQKFIFND